jgi:hypothetical protein
MDKDSAKALLTSSANNPGIPQHHLDEQQIDNLLKTVLVDAASAESSVCKSLSRFLDESNVSMMGGWT